jgi:hypothetical protein
MGDRWATDGRLRGQERLEEHPFAVSQVGGVKKIVRVHAAAYLTPLPA